MRGMGQDGYLRLAAVMLKGLIQRFLHAAKGKEAQGPCLLWGDPA